MSAQNYSMEELNARAALSEVQIQEGKTYAHADVMDALRNRARQVA